MILIVSPHFDDGAMSCADHLRYWLSQGQAVRMLTLFSQGAPDVSAALARAEPAALDWQRYMASRLAEEREALRLLGVEGVEAGLVDAGFRGHDHRLSVASSRLRNGRIPDRDADVLQSAISALRPHVDQANVVLLPLALGSHVDHLIARRAGEALAPHSRIAYYADMPYAARLRSWNAAALALSISHRVSRSNGTAAKRRALEAYVSQRDIVQRMAPRFPELLMLKARAHAALRMPLASALAEAWQPAHMPAAPSPSQSQTPGDRPVPPLPPAAAPGRRTSE